MSRVHYPTHNLVVELRDYPKVHVDEISSPGAFTLPGGRHEVLPTAIPSDAPIGRQWLMDEWKPIEDWLID